ncbi:MAG TPA: XdhC family protein, partial [Gemmatimonadales bacterium]|nr:XdhC family protein [Gemmatimonadales bacterium]
MSELLQVAAALTRAAQAGQVSVLATVVGTEGSTYRRIGARMVALADGSHLGAVSAGCIEADVILRADQVRAAGVAELVTYDTRSADDLIWGSGAGCGGMTELLLEPLHPQQALAKAKSFRSIAEARRPGVLATV